MWNSRSWWTLVVVLATTPWAWAQDEDVPRFEVGAQLMALDLRGSLGEKPGGAGGRFGYNLNSYLTLEAEVNHFPQNPDGNFGETQALFGPKLTYRRGDVGVFAKARPGFVHFGGDFYRRYNGNNPTFPAFDIGGGIEYYLKPPVALRLDFGDTIIPFGNRQILTGDVKPFRGGTRHNTQIEIGIVVRF